MTPEQLSDAVEGIHRATMAAVGATVPNIILLGLSQVALVTMIFLWLLLK